MKYLLILGMIATVLGCKPDEEIKNDGIVGRWELYEACLSTGAGCTWQRVEENERKTLELRANGTATGNFLPECITDATYTYNGTTLSFTYSSCKIGFPDFVISELSSTQLRADGKGCIEQCSWRFRAVK